MKEKLIRITTIPISLEKLLEGQLAFMSQYYDVTAVSSEEENLKKLGINEGVRTYHIPLTRKITPLTDIRAVIKLYRYLKKEKPLIVHTHTPKAGIVGMMAAALAGIPIRLHTVAGLPLTEATGVKRMILNVVEKLTYRYATMVYPNSRGLKEIILKEHFCDSKKLKVLGEGSSNGIDSNYFSPTHFSEETLKKKREELRIHPSELVFIFVGRLVKDKGLDELVAAFKLLQQANDHCTLLLVGPYEDDLDPVSEHTRKEIETNSKIICTGYQQDIRIYLAISDIFVFPSYREGFPNVVMQAGAMELPAIVSNINGCNEIVKEGFNGLIVPVKNKEILYEKMTLLANNRSKRELLSSNARQEIKHRYERKKMWEIILEEYRIQEANL
ncbi:MAG: glycosyltransferase family 1 protein [Flavobacterium sp.]|nr:MAG: glycosyltransferase family 1 protein [Flavobacterium sp.]